MSERHAVGLEDFGAWYQREVIERNVAMLEKKCLSKTCERRTSAGFCDPCRAKMNLKKLRTKEAAAWMRKNAAALLQIALDEDHGWLRHGSDGPLDDAGIRRTRRVTQDFIRKNG